MKTVTKIFSVLLGLALVVVLAVCAFYQFENYTGRKAWEKYVRECGGWVEGIEAEKFADPTSSPRTKNYIWLKDILPPPVDEDKNFAALPFWEVVLADTKTLTDEQKQLKEKWEQFIPGKDFDYYVFAHWDKPRRAGANLENGYKTKEEAVQALGEQLKAGEAFYKELRDELRRRPQCRYPVKTAGEDELEIRHLAALKSISLYAAAHAYFQMEQKQNKAAVEDVLFLLDLSDTLAREPFMISQLVHIVLISQPLAVIWEGIEADFWTDEDLQTLQERLAKVDLWNDLRLSLMGERAFANEQLISGKSGISKCYPPYPKGWYYRSVLEMNLMTDAFLDTMDREEHHFKPVFADIMKTYDYYMTNGRARKTLVILAFPPLKSYFVRISYTQFIVNAAQIACALERYRHQNDRYPASLKALRDLMPEDQIPRDWVTDKIPQIRQTDTGYILWSNGWDRADDQGKKAYTKNEKGQEIPDRSQGDWVWEISR